MRSVRNRRLFYGAMVLVLVVLSALMPAVMRVSVAPFMYRSIETVPPAQTAIVLGASVVRGKPSPVLRERAFGALELYRAGLVETILISGDGRERSHDEVIPVQDLLIERGVPEEAIRLDRSGFDTYSSIHRARDVYGVESAIIATQDFHLPRALYIAKSLGLTAYGLVRPGGETWGDYLRETPASWKAYLDLSFTREPATSEEEAVNFLDW